MEFLLLILAVFGAFQHRRLNGVRAELALLRKEIDQLKAEPLAREPEPEPVRQAVPALEITPAPSELVPKPAAVRAPRRFEEELTVRWAVWLGGATAALGAIFLAKYSIDQGWVGPLARMVLGLLLGAALIVAAEVLRRSSSRNWIGDTLVGQAHVPAALAGAGLASMFASIYAGYELYDLLAPTVTFVALAGVAFAALVLSLRQGPLIAVLGMVGGYVVPALVGSSEPSAVTLFAYILLLAGACLVLVRYTEWWWLAGVALGGSVLWGLAWMAFSWDSGDGPVVGGFAVLLNILVGLALEKWRPPEGEPARRAKSQWPDIPVPHLVTWLSSAAASALLLAAVRMDAYSDLALGLLAVAVVVEFGLGRWDQVFDRRPLIAGVTILLAIAGWHVERVIADDLWSGDINAKWLLPEADRFLRWAAALAAVCVVGGLALLAGAIRPWRWSVPAAAVPVVALAIAFARVAEFAPALPWSAAGLALAAFNLAVAAWLARWRATIGYERAMGVFAIAVFAAIALAMAMGLRQAWLTVALSAVLPAMAWVNARIVIPGIRLAALVAAGVVIARLLLNPYILDYPIAPDAWADWLLYGYGLPALAFWWAARTFRASADDALVMVLEAGALAFAVVLVWLEIRLWTRGGIDARAYDLFESSLHALALLTMSYGLLRLERRAGSRPVRKWAWQILGALASAQIAVVLLMLPFSWGGGDDVGDLPILNLLLLAVGLPAVFGALFFQEAGRLGYRQVAVGAGAAGLLLGLLYATLEVRHAFRGADIVHGRASDTEWYAYSAIWLLYGGALLAAGLLRGVIVLRHAALAVITLTIAKVFLFDMAALTGLLRAASFLGLGLCLVAIGWLYQRFVFPVRGAT